MMDVTPITKTKIGVLLHSLNKERTGRLAARAKFAEEFPCEHGTSFRQICEPNPKRVRLVIDSLVQYALAKQK